MTLAEKILFLRKREGLSQEELAEQLELSRQAIYKWECGESVPSIDKIKSLAALFHVSFDYLMNDNVESPDTNTAAPVWNSAKRAVYYTGNVLAYNQIDMDNGFGEDSGSVSFEEALSPNARSKFHGAKDVLAEFHITDLFLVQEMSNIYFFYDSVREVVGFFYAGAVQFVCPVENVLGFTFGGGERTLRPGSAPVIGFGVGAGGTSVMAGRAPTVTEDLESEVWASLTYQDGNDIKELPLEFDVICSHFLGKIHDYDMASMTEECTKSLLKNLTRLQAKLAALQEKVQSIRTGALKVKETDLQEFARRNESLMADYEEYTKTLSEIAANAKKNSRIKTAVAIGAVAIFVTVLIIICINIF